MTMTQTKAATKQSNAVVQNTGAVIPGLEGVGQDLLIIPRLKMVQQNSVEVMGNDMKPGSIVNSVTKDLIAKPSEQVTLIPILNTQTRIFFKPVKDGGGILCRSFNNKDGQGEPGGDCFKCPKNKWGVDLKGEQTTPECAELLNIFCIVRGYDFPIPLTVSFKGTSMGAGKQLVNFFWADAQKNQISPWNFAYELKTEFKENKAGQFFVFKVNPGGKAQKEEIAKGGIFYNLIKSTTVQIHEDEDEIKAEQARNANDSPEEPNAEDAPEDNPW